MAHTAPAALLFYIVQGLARALRTNSESNPNGAMNFFIVIFHLSTRKATMNASRPWKLRKECLIGIG
jgi:hypothetical protein